MRSANSVKQWKVAMVVAESKEKRYRHLRLRRSCSDSKTDGESLPHWAATTVEATGAVRDLGVNLVSSLRLSSSQGLARPSRSLGLLRLMAVAWSAQPQGQYLAQ